MRSLLNVSPIVVVFEETIKVSHVVVVFEKTINVSPIVVVLEEFVQPVYQRSIHLRGMLE